MEFILNCFVIRIEFLELFEGIGFMMFENFEKLFFGLIFVRFDYF
jgi:hypothetical protein